MFDLVRVAARLPPGELVTALEAARWPQEKRERLLRSLEKGEQVDARVIARREGEIEVEIGGDRVSLRLAAAAPSGQPGPTVSGPPYPLSSVDVGLSGVSRNLLRWREAELVRPAQERGPLTNAPSRDATPLGEALRQDMVRSGLFYESHLARWTQGEYPLEDIRREPQARELSGGALAAPLAENGSRHDEGWPHPELVRRQLDTLERDRIAWAGALWPGQDAQIEVGPEPRQAPPGSARAWEAKLLLELPHLGTVRATLRLEGAGARVDVVTQDLDARKVLSGARGELARALADGGIVATHIEIQGDGNS